MKRLFVAIDLPATVKEELKALFFGVPGARWVPEEQLHLTVRFIGEVEGGTFLDIRDSLAEVQASSFTMRLQGLGHFPPRGAPRVLWVGTEKNETLLVLKKKIDRVLEREGLEPERRKFSPHITLARLRDTPLKRLMNFVAGNGLFATHSFEVTDFHLYSSQLSSQGAVHTLEASYPLDRSS